MAKRVPLPVADTPVTYSPTLDVSSGLLAGGNYENACPLWARVNRAWNTMAGAGGLGLPSMKPGTTIDEAMTAEAERVDRFSEHMRGYFARVEQDATELRLLRGQREALRSLLGLPL